MCELNGINPYFNSFNIIQSTFSDLIRNDKVKKTSLSSAIYELGSIQCEFSRLQKIEEKLKQYEKKIEGRLKQHEKKLKQTQKEKQND